MCFRGAGKKWIVMKLEHGSDGDGGLRGSSTDALDDR